jgi:hypothetical protein
MVTKAKMETSAQKYRRIKEERLRNVELHDLETPSGMVWKVRRPDLQQFIISGVLPMSLAEKLSSSKDTTAAVQSMDFKDQMRSIAFASAVVRHCAVEPRIVETATADNEIGFDEVEMDDYNAILAWAVGGGAAAGLDRFH